MKKLSLLFILLFLPILTFSQKNYSNPEISAKDLYNHLKYIASDELEGRFTGSNGEKLAYEYIINQYKQYGLKPAYKDGYIQSFPFVEKVELTPDNNVSITSAGKTNDLVIKENYITAPFSGTVKINTQLVFAGYGISAPKLNYDDYSGIDVKGKIVVVMKYHPEYDKASSDFDSYSSFRLKAGTAKEHGAIGIIMVNGFYPENPDDNLPEFRYEEAPLMANFAAIQVKRSFIDELFKSENLNFADYQKNITQNKKPASFLFKDASALLQTGVVEKIGTGHNIAVVLEGTDPVLKNEYIVIGAHYDHLGWGTSSSLYKGPPAIHNGADDNGSGTVGVLELAEKYASVHNNRRSIIFVNFSGEELGILGSSFFVNNSPIPLDKITAMLNLDMVGRLADDNTLNVIGAATAKEFKNILNRRNNYNFKLMLTDDGNGGSDQQAFVNKKIPVLFFFTAMHQDYHRPSDKYDKINYPGEEKALKFVYDVSTSIDSLNNMLQYVQVSASPSKRITNNSKVTFGTMPEFSYKGKGYKISGVSDNKPAQKAGLKGGDIIIKVGTKTIDDIYDFMNSMNDLKIGDNVDVIVMRDDKEMTFKVKLEGK